jgi:rod shape-determining protein MreC
MKNLFRFFYQNSFVIGFLLLQGVSFWLIANYTYYQQSVLYQSGNNIAGNFSEKKSSFTNYLNLEYANAELVKENAELKNNSITSFSIVNKEYTIINDTLRKIKYRYYNAKVINSTYHRVKNFITLNKGLIGGLKPNMAVVNSKGLVGITTSVSDNFSVVLPIINPRAMYSVQVKHKYYFGILKWNGKNYRIAQIDEVANHAELIIGDTIETRESDIFPEGIPVGKVVGVEPIKGSNFLNISVELFVDFNSIYYVYAIENLMKNEQQLLEKEGYQ